MPLPESHLNKLKELIGSRDHEQVKNGVSLLEALLDNEDDLRRILRAVKDRTLSASPQLDEIVSLFKRHQKPHRSIIAMWILSLMAQFNKGIVDESLTLSLSNSDLDTVPSVIGTLINLQNLDLQDNRLSTLPDRLSNFKGLQTLNLSGNLFTELPTILSTFTQLVELKLHRNPLESLPSRLTALNIDAKQWSELHEQID